MTVSHIISDGPPFVFPSSVAVLHSLLCVRFAVSGTAPSQVEAGAMMSDGTEGSESLDDLFCEIWERESQPELSFPVTGVGSVRCHVMMLQTDCTMHVVPQRSLSLISVCKQPAAVSIVEPLALP